MKTATAFITIQQGKPLPQPGMIYMGMFGFSTKNTLFRMQIGRIIEALWEGDELDIICTYSDYAPISLEDYETWRTSYDRSVFERCEFILTTNRASKNLILEPGEHYAPQHGPVTGRVLARATCLMSMQVIKTLAWRWDPEGNLFIVCTGNHVADVPTRL
jgi:hypothetical protein